MIHLLEVNSGISINNYLAFFLARSLSLAQARQDRQELPRFSFSLSVLCFSWRPLREGVLFFDVRRRKKGSPAHV